MPLLRMDTNPSIDVLAACWERIDADPQRSVYLSDTALQNVVEMVAAMGDTIVPCVAFMLDDPAALIWLSHVALAGPHRIPVSAVLNIYLMPTWRKRPVSPECAEIIVGGLRSYGIEHVWAFVRTIHVETRDILEMCGFTYDGVLPSWERYHGQWHGAAVYHCHFEVDTHV